MVKLFALTFAALLVCAHLADIHGDAYHRPLSMFRDYEPAWIGYAMFGLLLAIGVETVRTAIRVQAIGHAVIYAISIALLAAVAATPSNNHTHSECAAVVMAMMFVYYAVVLYRADQLFWLTLHLLMPSILMMAARYESYGIWQKGLILYYLCAGAIHHHCLAQWLPKFGHSCRRNAHRIKIKVGRRRTSPPYQARVAGPRLESATPHRPSF
jgi:hypothetical protein